MHGPPSGGPFSFQPSPKVKLFAEISASWRFPGVVMLEALIFVVFPFCMVYAMVSDILSMTIANRVPVILAATFAVVAPLTGMDMTTYAMHFAAGALVLCVTF